MKRALERLLEPLKGTDRYTVVSVIGGAALLTIYLYQGHHSFFTRRLARSLGVADGPYAAWYAHNYQFAAALLCMFLLPALFVVLYKGERLADHGLRLGASRFGFAFLGAAFLLLAPALYLNGGSAEFQAEYPLAKIAGCSAGALLLWELTYLVYYIAWEFFFRGFWQLGLEGRLGASGAMALQTLVSTIMHIGKPQGETLAAIVAGPVFGLVALRTRSVLHVILLHWYVGASTDLFCLLRAGRLFGGCP